MKPKTVTALQAYKDYTKKAHPNRASESRNNMIDAATSLEAMSMEFGDEIERLRDKGMTIRAIARKLHKSDKYVSAVIKYWLPYMAPLRGRNKRVRS
jgi:hypothetical protein